MDNVLSRKRVILIIEDDKLNMSVLKRLLGAEYEILEACNGAEGLVTLKAECERISVVILDLMMPVMDGYDFLKIVSEDSLLKNIPIIVATANDEPEEEERCLDLGASDFITKPYRPKIVLGRIASIIKVRESDATLSAIEIDELTGVYTKQAFYHHASLELKNNPDTSYDLMISDIEDFKMVNERYGEALGDEILAKNGDFLQQMPKDEVIAGRYGADRFVTLIKHGDFFLEDLLYESVEILKKDYQTNIEIVRKFGIYYNVDHNLPISTLCDRALMALETVKHQYGKVFAVYDNSIQDKKERQHRIELGMVEAIEKEQFKVYYQPKHDAFTGKMVGAEALVRWIHPEYGFMSPGEFIPLFERNGFITEVDDFVWNKTCKNIKRWIEEGIKVVPISVNKSRLNFDNKYFVDGLKKSIEDNEIPVDTLHIEVTESVFSDRLDELAAVIKECREYGFDIELDDFGAGYSSLNTLGVIPLDVVKLDMLFMKKINDSRRIRVLEACINLAKMLNLKTVAEGVETEDQLHILQRMGADMIQGYYFSKPLPLEEFEKYMREHV